MQLDKNKLNLLLRMNDGQLQELLQRIAKESGIRPESLGLNPQNIEEIRRVLGSATDADLEQYNRILRASAEKRGGGQV